jgi:hypothetical protein
MRGRTPGIALLTALLGCVLAPASRADLVIVDDSRSVTAGPTVQEAAPGTAVFNANIVDPTGYGGAVQESYLLVDGMTGYGGVSNYYGSGAIDAHAVFDVTFRVTEADWFWLAGKSWVNKLYDISAFGPGIATFSSSQGESRDLLAGSSNFEFGTVVYLQPLVDYRLVLSVAERDLVQWDFAYWDLSLTVPEPNGTFGILLALGLVFRARRAANGC